MAAILGMRGTGNFTADERPKNWREKILALFPNGEAPLTAILSQLASEGTDDPEFNWWEKRLPLQRLATNAAFTTETTLTFVSGAKDAVAGTILIVEATAELVRVTTDPANDTTLVVERSWGTVGTGGGIGSGGFLTIIGNVHEEGSAVPTSRSYAPTKIRNYTQIFRTSLRLTRTARRTRLRYDSSGPYIEAKREALSLHSVEMEKAFLFGEAVESTGAAGFPMRSTGGLMTFIVTNKGGSLFNQNGTLTQTELDSLCEEIFRYGSNEKLVLCGSTFLNAISALAKNNGTVNITPASTTYGMHITQWTSPFGTLMFKNHPLMSQHPLWRKDAFVIDTRNLIYRALDDTKFIKNRQNNGDDCSLDEFLTECGLEVHFEETHAYIQGVTGAA